MLGSYNRGLCFQLQDRTQFSDGDLIQLKRYWDRGMTSLGSVCREKITAAANQLSVDTEIVKVTNSTGLKEVKRNLNFSSTIKTRKMFWSVRKF